MRVAASCSTGSRHGVMWGVSPFEPFHRHRPWLDPSSALIREPGRVLWHVRAPRRSSNADSLEPPPFEPASIVARRGSVLAETPQAQAARARCGRPAIPGESYDCRRTREQLEHILAPDAKLCAGRRILPRYQARLVRLPYADRTGGGRRPEICQLLVPFLGFAGFDVLTASDGREAL